MKTLLLFIIFLISYQLVYSQENLIIRPEGNRIICSGDTIHFRVFDIPLGCRVEWLIISGKDTLLSPINNTQDFIYQADNLSLGTSLNILCRSTSKEGAIQNSNQTLVSVPPKINFKLSDTIFSQMNLIEINPGFENNLYDWEWILGNDICSFRVANFLSNLVGNQDLHVKIKDEFGCPSTFTFPLEIIPLPIINLSIETSEIVCTNPNSSSEFKLTGCSTSQIQKIYTDSTKVLENLVESFQRIDSTHVRVFWKSIGFEGPIRAKFIISLKNYMSKEIAIDLLVLNDRVPSPGKIFSNSTEPKLLLFESESQDSFDEMVFSWKSAPKQDLFKENVVRNEIGKNGKWCYVKDFNQDTNIYWLELYLANSSCKCRRIIYLNK
jgi:hypothetical protein